MTFPRTWEICTEIASGPFCSTKTAYWISLTYHTGSFTTELFLKRKNKPENVTTIFSSFRKCTRLPEMHYLYNHKKKKNWYLWKPQSLAAFNGATVPESFTPENTQNTQNIGQKWLLDCRSWFRQVTVSVLLFYSDC